MKCPNCNVEVNNKSKFCISCGHKLELAQNTPLKEEEHCEFCGNKITPINRMMFKQKSKYGDVVCANCNLKLAAKDTKDVFKKSISEAKKEAKKDLGKLKNDLAESNKQFKTDFTKEKENLKGSLKEVKSSLSANVSSSKIKRKNLLPITIVILAIFGLYKIFSNSTNVSNKNTPEKKPSSSVGISKNEFKNGNVITPEKSFKLIDEELYDVPMKTQVIQHYVVATDVTKDELKELLAKAFDEQSLRTGFEYHHYPNAIYIYVYESDTYNGNEQWVGMLAKSAGDEKYIITIDDDNFEVMRRKGGTKYGLTEKQRRDIFTEMINEEDRARIEAEKMYSTDISGKWTMEDMNKQNVIYDKLNSKYKKLLADKHKITLEQLKEIGMEGLRYNWPMPKYE